MVTSITVFAEEHGITGIEMTCSSDQELSIGATQGTRNYTFSSKEGINEVNVHTDTAAVQSLGVINKDAGSTRQPMFPSVNTTSRPFRIYQSVPSTNYKRNDDCMVAGFVVRVADTGITAIGFPFLCPKAVQTTDPAPASSSSSTTPAPPAPAPAAPATTNASTKKKKLVCKGTAMLQSTWQFDCLPGNYFELPKNTSCASIGAKKVPKLFAHPFLIQLQNEWFGLSEKPMSFCKNLKPDFGDGNLKVACRACDPTLEDTNQAGVYPYAFFDDHNMNMFTGNKKK